MLGINHITTATIIAVTIKEPTLAVPLAFVSHFALDVIPHHGEDIRYERGSAQFWPKIIADASLSLLVCLGMVVIHPKSALIIIACAFAAILPDLLWPIAWHTPKKGWLWQFFKFHKGIQHESPAGIKMEAVWLLATLILLVAIR